MALQVYAGVGLITLFMLTYYNRMSKEEKVVQDLIEAPPNVINRFKAISVAPLLLFLNAASLISLVAAIYIYAKQPLNGYDADSITFLKLADCFDSVV